MKRIVALQPGYGDPVGAAGRHAATGDRGHPVTSRAVLISALVLGLLAAPPAGNAQPTGKIPRIGVLDYGSASARQHLWQTFRQTLHELGYVETENIAFEYRWADGNVERLPDLAAELVRLKVDIIATAGVPAALAAKGATTTIPVVFMSAGEAVRMGLVPSLARHGGNVTGVSAQMTEVSVKWVELLKEAVPRISRFAVLWDEGNRANTVYANEVQVAARSLGLAVKAVGVRSPNDFELAFAAMTRERERVSALVVVPGAIFYGARKRLGDLAAKHRLPTVFGQREYAEAGGLIAYGANLLEDFRRGPVFVHKILKGAKPADLAVEQATKFELVVNLKTAKALGLAIPQSILHRADEVIR